MSQPYNTWTVRAGTTEPIEFQLTGDGLAVSLDGVTSVEIRLRRADLLTVLSYLNTTNPTRLAITSVPDGKVTYYPLSTDLLLAAGHYDVFFTVIDAASRPIPFPTGTDFKIRIVPTFAP